ncbi:DUF6752 domain-containing protein [Naasia aerilata]|uniref:DUF6752 domain-containing protein n=1 Tax=Naasia aerilata TaxID=1162966 RepID=A0ABM8GCE7_9MICO|nr:DUF6752 domain-containing protein [Naasia aerilata]BDZ45915.1 hypothetical protein GCM10025866_18240 [Naasia aerilata]
MTDAPSGGGVDAPQQSIQELTARVDALETAIAELREEIDETRRDDRRVAELYDLVFERLKSARL